MAEDKGLSLVDYARKQRQADCPVCRLPDAIKQQMLVASDKKIKRTVVMSWLKEVHSLEITDAMLTTHYSGKHEQ